MPTPWGDGGDRLYCQKVVGAMPPNRPHKNLGTKIGYDHFVNSDPITQLAYGRG